MSNVVTPLSSIKSSHTRNIFATKFFDSQSKIISGAADHQVNVTDLTTETSIFLEKFENRVKKVSVVDNYRFLSAVEDGTVQMSDTRAGKSFPSNYSQTGSICLIKSSLFNHRFKSAARSKYKRSQVNCFSRKYKHDRSRFRRRLG